MNKEEGISYREFKGWMDFYKPTQNELRQLDYQFKELEIYGNISLLDVGFGNGSLMKWASERLVKVAGVEINENLISEARKLGIEVYRSLSEIPEKSFDYITFMDVLEHLDSCEIENILFQANRIIKNDGFLVFRFPNCQSPAGLIEQFGDETHRSMLSLPILVSKLKRNGFQVISVSESRSISYFGNSLKNILARFMDKTIRKILRLMYKLTFGSGDTELAASLVLVVKKYHHGK